MVQWMVMIFFVGMLAIAIGLIAWVTLPGFVESWKEAEKEVREKKLSQKKNQN